MPILRSKLELYDAFSQPMMQIVAASNLGMEAVYGMQAALTNSIDTQNLIAAQAEMQQTALAAQQMQETIGKSINPVVNFSSNPVSAPELPKMPVMKDSVIIDSLNLTAVQTEIQALTADLEKVYGMQQKINAASQGLLVIPQEAQMQVQDLNNTIEQTNSVLNYLKENQLNLDTESAQSQLANLKSSVQDISNQQIQLQMQLGEIPAVQLPEAEITAKTIGFEQAQSEISKTEIMLQNLNQGVSEVQFPEVEAGLYNVQAMENQIRAVTATVQNLYAAQQRINTAAQNMAVIPKDTRQQISSVVESMKQVQSQLNYLNSNPFDLDTGAAQAQIEAIEKSIQGISNQQLLLQMQLPEIPAMQVPNIPPVIVPVQWETDNLPVFTGTGIERFQLEIQAAQAQIEKLTSKQAQMASIAQQINILPPGAVQDLQSVQTRMNAIQQQIQLIGSNELNLKTDAASNGLEQLRAQMEAAIQLQEQMNFAIETRNIQAANTAYMQLSGTIGRTEQYIRDNVSAQGQFNATILQGQKEANSLATMVKSAIGAYASITSIGSVINISDQFINTTARITQMNDGMQTTDQLIQMIYQSAQNARGSFGDMASIVARFGNNAKDAFSSSKEVIAFSNLIQKEMTIAGASTMEASNAMLQLSQALGSGVLRGDELNSIFEQAPNLIGRIADYMDVPIGLIRQMATEGKLSADVVKQAVFAAANDINDKFSAMPRTWGQIWQGFQNTALFAFRPILQEINAIANSQGFQNFVNNAIVSLSVLSRFTLKAFNTIGSIGKAIYDNWDFVAPVIYTAAAAVLIYAGNLTYLKAVQAVSLALDYAGAVAKGLHAAAVTIFTNATWAQASATATATAAQLGLNTAMYACPVVWILGLVVALVAVFYLAVAAVNHFAGTTLSATGMICGAFAVALAFIGNLFIAAANLIIDTMVTIANAVRTVANFVATVFVDPVNAVIQLFVGLANTVLNILSTIAGVIDTVFGSNLAAAVNNWKGAVAEYAAGLQVEAGATVIPEIDASQYKLQRFDYGEAYDKGYNFGADLSFGKIFGAEIPAFNGMPDMLGSIAENTGALPEIAGNTGGMKDALEIKDEDLKYLRDLAEQEAINRYTTAEINIDMTNNNRIEQGMSTSGFVSYLTDAVNEAIDVITEGVHA